MNVAFAARGLILHLQVDPPIGEVSQTPPAKRVA
jgi:hypothetical protein